MRRDCEVYRLGDIGQIIQEHAEGCYSVVREYCGHGIIRYSTRNLRFSTTDGQEQGWCLRMTFTIEPMINGKRHETQHPMAGQSPPATVGCRRNGNIRLRSSTRESVLTARSDEVFPFEQSR